VIRFMEVADVGHCVDLGERFHQSSYWNWIPYSKERTAEFGMQAVADPNRLALVAEDLSKNEIYGFFIAVASRMYFAENHRCSSEEIMFVSPDKRGGVTALRFMKAWEEWCKDMNVCHMAFNPTSHGQGDRWDGFMKKLGYTKAGECFRKAI
jgi:GNAT superfamily N-acetyltransferase